MPELHDLLERRTASYEPPDDLLARVRERRRRRQRTRRAGGALVALVVSAVAVGGLARALPPSSTVLFEQPPDALVGTWVSIDTDGSSQTMDIRALDGAGYEVVLNDDAASVCSGAPATMTGTGQVDGAGLVIAAPLLTCDDGSTPVPPDGSSLEDAVRDYTIVHDPATDTLTDSLGVQWQRPTASPDPDTIEAPASGGFWPQSTIDEVREAQQKADAGDPAYTWQVEPAIGDVGGNAKIFSRFLTEELGWKGFRWGAASNYPGSMHWAGAGPSSEVDFVRCAAGELNPLYPNDPDGRLCAPTLDELGYETVRVTAYQPLVEGPNGIWVVQSSRPQPPFSQTVPPSDAEIAEAVEPFLQARVDGAGAGQHVDSDPTKIPLLYAASDGARYDRFDHEVLEGPMWPFGTVHVNLRLFADGGKTVVEQAFRLEQGFLEYARRAKPTTEKGAPVPEPYSILGGRVTFAADLSWEEVLFGPSGPDVIGFYHNNEHDHLFTVVGDPLAPTGSCGVGDQPPSADELVRSIRSSPNLSVSAPQATRVGDIDAVQLDVTSGGQAARCQTSPDQQHHPHDDPAVLAPRHDPDDPGPPTWWGVGPDSRARVYVFDAPGKPARTVAILVMAPKRDFESVLAAAEPIIESFEFTAE